MAPHFFKLAKYRVDFLRHCSQSFGIANSWRLFRLLRSTENDKGEQVNIPDFIAGTPLVLRKGTSDIAAFYKIFAWQEYHLKPDWLPDPVRTIIDLGSNIGLSVLYFASKFPTAKIVGLEPDSENYELLQANTKNVKDLNLIKGGAWKKSCSLVIENPDDRPDSYRLCECDPATPGSLSAFSISDLIEMFQLQEIDLLKIDIEGAEVQLFSEGYEEWLPKVHTLVIELHGEAIRHELVPKIGKYFKHHSLQGENDVFVR